MNPEEIYAQFPHMETAHLLLRALQPEDGPAIFRIFSDPRVTRYYDLDTFTSHKQALELIDRFRLRFASRIGLRWGIAQRANPDVLLGTCGFNAWFQSSQRAIVGYDLVRSHWRRGIISEALTAILHFGFEQMSLNRVEALTFVDNVPSQRLLEKLEFQREGVLREYEYLQGRFIDMAMYSLLHHEFAEKR
jgi:[ribosomal protein S5]-alanine N-acetyltransferase